MAKAVARDAAGNVSADSSANDFTVTPCAPTVTSPAAGAATNDATPTFSGTAPPNSTVTVREGTTVLCTATADAGGAGSCTPSTPLSDGAHSVTAVATVSGAAGPASPAASFTVDTAAPTVSISGGPGAETKEPTARFDLSSNEPGVTWTCSVDGGPFGPCTSPVELSGLGPGPHSIEVCATDAAGNVGTSRYEWVVTAAPPGSYTGGGCACGLAPDGALALLALGLLGLGRRRRSAVLPRRPR